MWYDRDLIKTKKMILIIDTIDLDIFGELESLIFLVGFIITSLYVLMFTFNKKTEVEEEQHYYGRHNIPLKEDE